MKYLDLKVRSLGVFQYNRQECKSYTGVLVCTPAKDLSVWPQGMATSGPFL